LSARAAKKPRGKPSASPAPSTSVTLAPLGTPLVGPGEPLCVTATLAGEIALPQGPLALDGLLAWAVCAREGLAAPVEGIRPVHIPVALAPGGRFHLCSFSLAAWEAFGVRYVNRRFPLPEAQNMGAPSLKRILLSGGPCKSFRLPLESGHLRDDRLTWYLQGDRARVAELLQMVTGLGKRRGVGLGRVARWEVTPVEPWPGFPVVREGRPLRPLPVDWPGVSEGAAREYRCVSFPYWLRAAEVECVVPDVMALPEGG